MTGANMKQSGGGSLNGFLRKRLGKDKNRLVKVDISKFMDKQEHDELMAKKENSLKLLNKAIWFLGIVVSLLYLSNLI